MPATKIVVNIPGEAPYDVRIGATVLAGLGESVRRLDGVGDAPHLLVLTDSNVGSLYLEEAKSSLKAAGFRVSDIVVPAGEDSKSLAVAGEIWSAMASLGLTRDCAVVALGGGVVGDLAGFVASTYMRGIPFVQVPTSLLAMVDSSVGGKTGVNLPEGKNLVGTFKQPVYVCASTAVLATLDDREWACGCAEIAKASVITTPSKPNCCLKMPVTISDDMDAGVISPVISGVAICPTMTQSSRLSDPYGSHSQLSISSFDL